MPGGERLAAAGLALLALLAVGGCEGPASPTPRLPEPPPERPGLPSTYRASGRAAAGDVFVHLFEWRWVDIAAECESVLGPAGFHAVQISPPQEHIVLGSHPWWVRYQPVSYRIDRSRSGSRAEFVDMVSRCRAAGVGVYVDAVVNHMTAGSGTGSSGTPYTKYSYPGLYARSDFHPGCTVTDYGSAANVQDCELLGLADLDTGLAGVQQKIADYLLGLVRLGVAGFRIDAAKHVQPVELDGIVALVNRAAAAEGRALPYLFAEVIDHGGEAVQARDYFGLGFRSGGAADISEFRFRGVGDKFLGNGGQKLADLRLFGAGSWGLMPSDKAVVFLENHDTQREGGIGYRSGAAYRLANVWMLAQPYGYPSVMSSYAFDRSEAGRSAGPPSSAAGETNRVSCAASMDEAVLGQWVCEHRDPFIRRMVGFRRAVAGADLRFWWDNGGNAIAFSRGDKGFVAINREITSTAASVSTGLPAGTYCDVLSGGRRGADCAGARVVVDAAGRIALELEANSAVVVHAGTRL